MLYCRERKKVKLHENCKKKQNVDVEFSFMNRKVEFDHSVTCADYVRNCCWGGVIGLERTEVLGLFEEIRKTILEFVLNH